jgi:L-lactate dehydrogenase complex protein LldG
MSARNAILGALAKHRTGPRDDAALQARIDGHRRNLIPARGNLPSAERLALFRRMAEGVQASVDVLADVSAVPGAVADYLAQHNLPTQVRLADHAWLRAADWAQRPLLETSYGAAALSHLVGINVALAGIAETGTLMFASGPASPITLSFVPDTQIALVGAASILPAYEDGWDALRAAQAAGAWPRAVNFVTGPSRTADIEQRLILGAHGPRRLHILVIDAPPESA